MAATKRDAPRAVEVDGIEVKVSADVNDDYELVELSYTASDEDAPIKERTHAITEMYRRILGPDYQRVKDELRGRNGGRLPFSAMTDFMGRVLDGVRAAKN